MNHHGAGLRTLLGSDAVPRALARDWRTADIPPPDHAMLTYAVKLTVSPHAVTQLDVDTLRGVGFDDVAVLDICQVVAYYNYVNRLADGLGVDMENWWKEEDLIIGRAEFEALHSHDTTPDEAS